MKSTRALHPELSKKLRPRFLCLKKFQVSAHCISQGEACIHGAAGGRGGKNRSCKERKVVHWTGCEVRGLGVYVGLDLTQRFVGANAHRHGQIQASHVVFDHWDAHAGALACTGFVHVLG